MLPTEVASPRVKQSKEEGFMETISRSQFEANKGSYSKLVLLETHKNGSEDYSYVCHCAKCNGTGHLNWTSLDQGRCWICQGTGRIRAKVHVVSDEQEAKARAKRLKEAEQFRQNCIAKNTEMGYKDVDFKLADWFFESNARMFKYYAIISETEKALYISFLNFMDTNNDYRVWIPKKAIIK